MPVANCRFSVYWPGSCGVAGIIGAVVDLLLPRTDTGVAFQFLIVAGTGAVAVAVAWSRAHLRTLAIGTTLLLLSLMSLRALH